MLIQCVGLLLALVSLDGSFEVQSRYPLPSDVHVSGEVDWTYWSYCSVSPSGEFAAILLPDRREVCCVRLGQSTAQVVAARTNHAGDAESSIMTGPEAFGGTVDFYPIAITGRQADQVSLPLAVCWGADSSLYISDNDNRRVSVFDDQGTFRHSFLLPPSVDAPWCVQRYAGDTLLLSSLRLADPRRINAGFHCHVVTPEGELVRSFAYTPDLAFSRNLWTGVAGHSVVGARGVTYVAFSCEYTVGVYDRDGNCVTVFGEQPSWWVSPPVLPDPEDPRSDLSYGLWSTWTRVVKLLLFDGDKLLRVTETNGLVSDCAHRFILDVFSTDGALLTGGIVADYWPVGAGVNGDVYFLSLTGDEIIRTRFNGGEQ